MIANWVQETAGSEILNSVW